MPCLTCLAEHIASGSSRVLPELRRRLPLKGLRPVMQYTAMPAIILTTGYLAFADPRFMTLIVPVWLLAAYRLGHTGHCPPGKVQRKKRRKGRTTDEHAITRYKETYHPDPDPQNGPDRLQCPQARQDTPVVPDPQPTKESELTR